MAKTPTRLTIAESLHHLFNDDDGSLPDIFIENISIEEFHRILEFVEAVGSPASFRVWSIEIESDQNFTSPTRAARLLEAGKVEGFRFPVNDIKIGNQTLPTLGFGIYETGYIEFDYRMGKDWTDSAIIGLLEFLHQLMKIAPKARIQRAEEGNHSKFDAGFSAALSAFRNL